MKWEKSVWYDKREILYIHTMYSTYSILGEAAQPLKIWDATYLSDGHAKKSQPAK